MRRRRRGRHPSRVDITGVGSRSTGTVTATTTAIATKVATETSGPVGSLDGVGWATGKKEGVGASTSAVVTEAGAVVEVDTTFAICRTATVTVTAIGTETETGNAGREGESVVVAMASASETVVAAAVVVAVEVVVLVHMVASFTTDHMSPMLHFPKSVFGHMTYFNVSENKLSIIFFP